MLKIIYVAICVLNVLMYIALISMVRGVIKEHNLHIIKKVPSLVNIVALMVYLFFALVPILHLLMFVGEVASLYTEDGKEIFFEKVLENYE